MYYGGRGGVDGSRAHGCAAAAAVLVLQRKPRAARDRKSPGFAVTYTYLQEVCRPPKAFRKYGIKWLARSVRAGLMLGVG